MFSIFFKSYILIPAAMLLLSATIRKHNLLKYMLVFAAVIGYMSFHLAEPNQASDLYWHYKTLESFKSMGFSYFFVFEKSASLPIYSLYFYLISLLPSLNYLPAITAFLVYAINFYFIYRVSKRFDLTKRSTIILVLFILCNLNYAGVIMGIRFNLAVSICLLGVYLDLVEKKSLFIILPLYISALFMHTSIFIILLLRILIIPFFGKMRTVSAISLVVLTFLGLKLLPTIAGKINLVGLNDSLDELFSKVDVYLENAEQGAFWTVPYYALLILFFAWIGFRALSKYGWSVDEIGKIQLFYILLLVMAIVFFDNYVVLGRIVIMCNLIAVPIIGLMFSKENRRQYSPRSVTYLEACIVVESLLRLFYYLYLGGYGAIKLIW